MRYYANWCQLVLAVVEIVVTKIKAKRLADGEKKSHRRIDFSTQADRATEKASKPDASKEVLRKKTMATCLEIWPSTSTASKTGAH